MLVSHWRRKQRSPALPLLRRESCIAYFFKKLLLLKRRWHKRSAVTEEFYIQLCALNSLLGLQLNSLPAKAVLPLKEGELHKIFCYSLPIGEGWVGPTIKKFYKLSIQETKCPKRDYIHIAIFNIILDNKGFLHTLYLFLFLVLTTHLKCIFPNFEIGNR